LAPTGTLIDVAAVLLLFGAFTKSAQFPFHFWLPGAMAAPTPVSAYLHSATMVKAGIVLLARTSPVFADSGVWRWWVVLAGIATMFVGGWSALRQSDAKLLLAHSTVSQLGLLTVLFGIGSPIATYAGVAHLVAHAIFKAGLFLGVGVIDHEIGTRDVSRIGSARSKVPISVAALVACTLSMAGIIPLFGFVTKEKSLVALLDSDLGLVGAIALWGVVAGSVLSVAYSARFLRALVTQRSETVAAAPATGAHGSHDEHGAHDSHSEHHTSKFVAFVLGAPVTVAAVVSVAFGLIASQVGKWLIAPSASLDVDAPSKLVLWPGINDALIISVIVIAVGAVVGWRTPLTAKTSAGSRGERAFDSTYDAILSASKRITTVTQPGSLPIYVVVTAVVIAAAAVVALMQDGIPAFDGFVSDSPLTIAVAFLTALLSVGVAVVSMRFTAAVFLGGVGYGIGVLFLMRGAPDLALTQVLVETLAIVIFLLVMREMPKKFVRASKWPTPLLRVVVSVAVGVLMPLIMLAVHAARTRPSVSDDYLARSVPEAGGANVVNVVLVDFRGFDTLGEITVLAVAALGVVNLVRVAERNRRARIGSAGGAAHGRDGARVDAGRTS
jgi:multicomponent Na+:H+ antiporter subunit A